MRRVDKTYKSRHFTMKESLRRGLVGLLRPNLDKCYVRLLCNVSQVQCKRQSVSKQRRVELRVEGGELIFEKPQSLT